MRVYVVHLISPVSVKDKVEDHRCDERLKYCPLECMWQTEAMTSWKGHLTLAHAHLNGKRSEGTKLRYEYIREKLKHRVRTC